MFSSKKANKAMQVRAHGETPENPPVVLEIIFHCSQDISMSFQICFFQILVGNFTNNLTGHNLLTDSTLKKVIQKVLVSCLPSCLIIMRNWWDIFKIWSDK